jgi:hypothetical protein
MQLGDGEAWPAGWRRAGACRDAEHHDETEECQQDQAAAAGQEP